MPPHGARPCPARPTTHTTRRSCTAHADARGGRRPPRGTDDRRGRCRGGRARGRALTARTLVLIAERDRNVCALQRVFLERAGLAVEFMDDGAAALERARLAPPAVLVTEILLPTLDGLTLCRRLRDEPATAHVPVVVFSMLAAAARAAEAGARTFLRKPLVESTFVAAVLGAIATQPPRTSEQPQWVSR